MLAYLALVCRNNKVLCYTYTFICGNCSPFYASLTTKGVVCEPLFRVSKEWTILECKVESAVTSRKGEFIYSAPELMVYLNMMGFGGRLLVIGTTVETHIKYD